jgi:UDP-2,4-diacetamido-2,4,6-trideoxy-beta-L-altropyranose hydrolase
VHIDSMNIIFRVDSSSKIGIGHLMRCLALAEQYQKDNITFAVQSLKGDVNQKIIDKGYKLIILDNNSIDELCKYIELLDIETIVFDHYSIDDKFEKGVKDKTGVQILSFDDTYEKHYCDILLNHNIYADVGQYKDLVPKFCEIRCGKEYTLIRDEFKKIKIRNRPINKGRPVVFVSLGGSDASNISLAVLKILAEFDGMLVNLATINANQNIDELQYFAKQHQNINICIDCNIAEMMNNSDFAIITPSVILYEAMFLKLPFISIKIADNQEIMHQYLLENNHHVFNENELNELSKEIRKYV